MSSDPKPPHDPEPNDRQRKFIEAVARGLSVQEAAKSAGFSASYARKASRLLKQPLIGKAIAAIRQEGNKLAAYGLAEAMKEAESAATFARANKNSMALVKATELRARLSGLLIELRQELPPIDLKGALTEARARVFTIVDITPGHGHESATRVLTAAQAMVAGPARDLAADGSPKWTPLSGD